MSLKEFKTLNVKDYELAKVQDNTSEFISQIISNPILGGVLLKGLDVTTTATDFAHGLGREPVGYFIVKANAQVTVFDTVSTTPKVALKLTGSTTATINLWVF